MSCWCNYYTARSTDNLISNALQKTYCFLSLNSATLSTIVLVLTLAREGFRSSGAPGMSNRVQMRFKPVSDGIWNGMELYKGVLIVFHRWLHLTTMYSRLIKQLNQYFGLF